MEPSRLQRVREVFDAVEGLQAEAREAEIARLCTGDSELAAEVRSLLGARRDAGSFLSTPAIGHAAAASLAEAVQSGNRAASDLVGRTLGQYKITGELGQGGMGVVLRAEQDRPRRTVALKLIRSLGFSASLLRRFEHEAQILGRLKHPGIAQIFEAGSINDDQGRSQPFFAMELVEGPGLLAFVAEQRLGTRERLELFTLICDAVEHAHQKGVVHRDLKPSNILVESTGGATTASGSTIAAGSSDTSTRAGRSSLPWQPKILDFGVARATDSDIAATTMQTGVGQVIGTLQYMSPEQVRGEVEHVDTRSDVYALGVILYELLTGKLPYELRNRSLAEAARIIGEQDPTRISLVERTLRGDIETIVSKAMDKDAARRYSSAAALGADIRRFLSDLPIVARPPSAGYQLRKFARRNRALVGGVIATIIVLLGGVVGTSIGLLRATEARALAEQREETAKTEARKAKRSVQFLVGMLTAANPDVGAGREVTVREILDKAAGSLQDELKDDPDVLQAAETAVARTYRAIGRYKEAEAHLDVAQATAAQLYGDQSIEVAELLHERAKLQGALAKWPEVKAACDRALAVFEAKLPATDTRIGEVCETLSGAHASSGDLKAADRFARRALEIAKAAGDPHRIASSSGVLASVVERVGGKDWTKEAESLKRLEYETLRDSVGAVHSSTLTALGNLATFLGNQGRNAEALPLQEQVVEGFTKLYGRKDERTLGAIATLAGQHQFLGDLATAERLGREAMDGLREAAPGSAALASACSRLGLTLQRAGKIVEAEPILREAVAIRRASKSPNLVPTLSALSGVLRMAKRYQESDDVIAEAIDLRRAAGSQMVDTAILLNNRAEGLGQWGKDAEADALYKESIELDRKLRPGNRGIASNLRSYCTFLLRRGRATEALPLAKEAFDLTEGQPIAQRKGVVQTYFLCLSFTGDSAAANSIRALLPPESQAEADKLLTQIREIMEQSARSDPAPESPAAAPK